jgi:E3 ubiquitin-protein ligase SIAH1
MSSNSKITEDIPESELVETTNLVSNSGEIRKLTLGRTWSIPVNKSGVGSSNSVHELLECPVCAISMYPPIHQVMFSMSISLAFFQRANCKV